MVIFRYLAREIFVNTITITVILLVVFISDQFVKYLGRTAKGYITVTALLKIMSLQIPLLAGLLLPLGLFLGILLAYGRLYNDNEMTVMQACGMSKARLVRQTFLVALVVSVFVGVLMLWVQPKMAWYRNQALAEAASASPLEKILPGRFMGIAKGKWVIYSKSISRDRKNLYDVFVAETEKKAGQEKGQVKAVVTAKRAYQEWNNKLQSNFIVFTDGYRYAGTPGQKDYQVIHFKKYGMRIPTIKIKVGNKAEIMPSAKLWQLQGSDKEAAAELQWRISIPLSALLLALLAVPLSSAGPRRGRYVTILPGMMLYIGYAQLLFMGQAWVEKGKVSPAFGMWWVHL